MVQGAKLKLLFAFSFICIRVLFHCVWENSSYRFSFSFRLIFCRIMQGNKFYFQDKEVRTKFAHILSSIFSFSFCICRKFWLEGKKKKIAHNLSSLFLVLHLHGRVYLLFSHFSFYLQKCWAKQKKKKRSEFVLLFLSLTSLQIPHTFFKIYILFQIL